ncbi:MAG: glycosyltransferase [Lachnospiraceae bacterium]|nr:glycosyltransferase [Lachnospiraceae bacterium]
MKILMVNKFLHPVGGTETYIFKLGDYLKKLGHEVQYFGMEHEGRMVGNEVEAYTEDMDFHGGSRLVKLTYPIKTIYSVNGRRKIRQVLDSMQPDVVHLNNFNYQLTPAIILEIVKWRKETGKVCRIVFTAHDYNLVCPNHMLNNPVTGRNCERCIGGHFINCALGKCIHGSRAKSLVGMTEGYYWKLRKTYGYIDTVICCSAFMKTKMDTNPLLAKKTIVMHNFIDKLENKAAADEIGTERAAAISEKKAYVLYFGRFAKEKGVATLIDVCRSLPDIPFIFAGAGPLEHKIGEAKNIKNVGFKTGIELENLIRRAAFSIYPSEWYENCPFSVMESLMYGTPVIGADIGGIPELVVDGKTGDLFKASDARDLRKKLKALWTDKERLQRYTDNCKDISFDDIEVYTQRLLKVYRGRNVR